MRFSAETSYSAEYRAHAIEPRPAPPALLPHRSGPRFDSVSSYTVRCSCMNCELHVRQQVCSGLAGA